jgi:hypothetical protein
MTQNSPSRGRDFKPRPLECDKDKSRAITPTKRHDVQTEIKLIRYAL